MRMPASEIIHDLRTLPCLSGLKNDELSSIGEKTYVRTFLKNEVLFREKDSVNFIFVIKTGSIKLFKTSPEGRELSIKMLGPSEYFCCAPLYLDGKYSVSAMARQDSMIVVIPANGFKKLISTSVNEIGQRMIAGLCSRIKYLSGLVENLAFRDVEQRIILVLSRLADEKSPDENIVPLTVTHQDIASMIGSVREVVSRTMLKLKKDNIIVDSSASGFKVDKAKVSKHLKLKKPLLNEKSK
jgi:CRP-like cAMP-binding protein